MDEFIKVKEEPLESEDDLEREWMQNAKKDIRTEVEAPLEKTVKMEDELIIKTEFDYENEFEEKNLNYADIENLNVVDERDNIITVNAADLKTDDEKKFIKCFQLRDGSMANLTEIFGKMSNNTTVELTTTATRSFGQTCKKSTARPAITQERICPVCPMAFVNVHEWNDHVQQHKSNRFFCKSYCGRHFENVNDCEVHEYNEHEMADISCKICHKQLETCKDFIDHMMVHSSLKRFVCSMCRMWFSCSIDLAKHWQINDSTCGVFMQDIVRQTIETIESSLTAFNIGFAKEQHQQQQQLHQQQQPQQKQNPNDEILSTIKIKTEPMPDENQDLPTLCTISNVIKQEPIDDSNDAVRQESVSNQERTSSSSSPLILADLPIGIKTPKTLKINPVRSLLLKPLPSGNKINVNVLSPIKIANGSNAMKTTMSPPSSALKANANLSILSNPNIKITPLSNVHAAATSNVMSPALLSNGKLVPLQNHSVKITPWNINNLKIIKLLPQTTNATAALKWSAPSTNSSGAPTAASNANSLSLGRSVLLKLKGATKIGNSIIRPVRLPATTVTPIRREVGQSLLKSAATCSTEPKRRGRPRKWSSHMEAKLEAAESMQQQRRNECKTSVEIKVYEHIPEKRAIINNLRSQFKKYASEYESPVEAETEVEEQAEVEREAVAEAEAGAEAEVEAETEGIDSNTGGGDSGISDIDPNTGEDDGPVGPLTDNKEIEREASPSGPPTLYLPLHTNCDAELLAVRRKHPTYSYVWMCPHCPRFYSQKYSFRGHLLCMHALNKDDYGNQLFEVKPLQFIRGLEKLSNSSRVRPVLQGTLKMQPKDKVVPAREPVAMKSRKTNVKLTCPKCGRTCSTRTSLNDHLLANCSRDPQYPCPHPDCNKKFFSSSTLNQHMSVHTGALPHKCSFCDKRFRTRGQVTVHHRTHTGERPFECQVCSQRFTHRETLISHLSRHIGMKRYKCYACNQHFSCISGLKTHRDVRFDTCGQVKLNTRAVGPRVRVIKGNVLFEAQPKINPYLRTEDPDEVVAENCENNIAN